MWDRIKRWYSGPKADASSSSPPDSSSPEALSPEASSPARSSAGSLPPIPVIPADSPTNPYKVALLDVQNVTQHMLATSQNPQCAANAISFTREDGTSFLGAEPQNQTVIPSSLRYPVDPELQDGVLYTPSEMEHKWAVFYLRGKILFVRSWTREVKVVAETQIANGELLLPSIRGAFTGGEESADFTTRIADFLLRTLVLKKGELAPIPAELFSQPQTAAMWCMSMYGSHARFATDRAYTSPSPITEPLRSNSMFHIAVARGDRKAVEEHLAQGASLRLLSQDGMPPLHWALARKEDDMLLYLLERGSPIDVRSDEGATALMQAVQARSLARAALLLQRGADPNAVDKRGFTALHRACEMGELEIVRLLLEKGARKDLAAQGLTPRDLAVQRKEQAIISLLDSRT